MEASDEFGRNTVYLHVPCAIDPRVPARLELDDEVLVRVEDPHVTLFTGEDVLGVPEVDPADERTRRFVDACERAAARLPDLGPPEPRGDLLLVKHERHGEQRRSIIALVDVPGVDGWYDQLEADLGECFERPPLHVTLLKPEGGRGIGISTARDLEAWATRLER